MRESVINGTNRLILASGSEVRKQILTNAGLVFDVRPPNINEARVKAESHSLATKALAETLAEKKALKVSSDNPGSWVVGADRVLRCEGKLFDKPNGLNGVREHLVKLRGKTHHLISAVCVAKHDEIIWSHIDSAKLVMRELSDQFIDEYVKAAGERAQEAVGAYRLEDKGIQLFSCIDGDYFTILGLPIVPLLEFFRSRGELLS